MKAIWKDTIIAESDATIELDGTPYFPTSGVNMDYLTNSDHRATTSEKGEACYYHIVVDGERIENGAWYYTDPKGEATQVEGYIAFRNGVEVTE